MGIIVGIFKCVSVLGSAPSGVAFVSDSDDDSQEDEEDADEALVLLDVLATNSDAVVVAKSDTDLVEEFSGRARLNAANAAASLGVEDPSSLSAGDV
jgi:hypothetical protein